MYRYNEDEGRVTSPVKLQTDRNPIKIILLSIFTLGIYAIIFFISLSFDINKIASRHDNKKTMNYLFAYLLAYVTFSIVLTVWHHQFAERVADELAYRKIDYKFGVGTFWGWGFFGSLILVGPFIYMYKLCRAMNLLCADYNEETEKEYKEHKQSNKRYN